MLKYVKSGSRVLTGNLGIPKKRMLDEGYIVTLCFGVENPKANPNIGMEFVDICLTKEHLESLQSVTAKYLNT